MVNVLEYLREIKKKYRSIIIMTLSFIFVASIYTTFFIKQDYDATTKIFIGKQKFQNTMETYNNEEITLYQRLITTYSELIKSKNIINESISDSKVNLLKEENEKLEYKSVIKDLIVNPITDTQIIELKYSSKNPQQSYDLLYSITENIMEYSKELYPDVNIKVLEQVNVRSGNLINRKIMIIAISCIIGLIFSIGITIISMSFNNTFNSSKAIEKELGIAVIGTIPYI